MNEDVILSLVRALLKIGGTWMLSKNLASGSDVETLISAAMILVGIVWGMMAKKPKPVPVPVPVPVPNPVPTGPAPIPAPTPVVVVPAPAPNQPTP